MHPPAHRVSDWQQLPDLWVTDETRSQMQFLYPSVTAYMASPMGPALVLGVRELGLGLWLSATAPEARWVDKQQARPALGVWAPPPPPGTFSFTLVPNEPINHLTLLTVLITLALETCGTIIYCLCLISYQLW